ncbi:nucleotide exchange factor GrpE, partial [Bacteroides fragilis]|nr:nucleotide exchange factor GrpE [Bacteroides fragilis]
EDAADQAEAAADAAADQGNSLEAQLAERTEDLQRLNEAELDPTLDADLEAALADVSTEDAADQAEAAADAAADQGNSLEAQLAERTEDL